MRSVFLALSLATVCAATVEEVFDDPSLSLIQLRASEHQRAQASAEALRPFDKMEKKINGEWGNELINRPKLDDVKCDTWDLVDKAWILNSDRNCKIEFRDDSLGAIRDGPGDMITGVKFYVAQAGNFRLQFRVYRNNGMLSEKSEYIDCPKAGVIQEVTFQKPMLLLNEDWVGWSHDGRGNFPYSEEPVYAENPQPVQWRITGMRGDSDDEQFLRTWQETTNGGCEAFKFQGAEFHRKVQMPAWEKRTYSYSLITRPATKDDLPEKICFTQMSAQTVPQGIIDSLPDGPPAPAPGPAPEPEGADGAAAVGDPHLTTNAGERFDIQ